MPCVSLSFRQRSLYKRMSVLRKSRPRLVLLSKMSIYTISVFFAFKSTVISSCSSSAAGTYPATEAVMLYSCLGVKYLVGFTTNRPYGVLIVAGSSTSSTSA